MQDQMDMPYDDWIVEVARLLGQKPEQVNAIPGISHLYGTITPVVAVEIITNTSNADDESYDVLAVLLEDIGYDTKLFGIHNTSDLKLVIAHIKEWLGAKAESDHKPCNDEIRDAAIKAVLLATRLAGGDL